jgi:hypothetical protein
MQRIRILFRVDRAGDHRRIDLGGQRKLDEDAVHAVVRVEALDDLEQLGLGRLGCQRALDRRHADPLARPLLALDVRTARRIVTDEHDGEARGSRSASGQLGDLGLQLVADRVRER